MRRRRTDALPAVPVVAAMHCHSLPVVPVTDAPTLKCAHCTRNVQWQQCGVCVSTPLCAHSTAVRQPVPQCASVLVCAGVGGSDHWVVCGSAASAPTKNTTCQQLETTPSVCSLAVGPPSRLCLQARSRRHAALPDVHCGTATRSVCCVCVLASRTVCHPCQCRPTGTRSVWPPAPPRLPRRTAPPRQRWRRRHTQSRGPAPRATVGSHARMHAHTRTHGRTHAHTGGTEARRHRQAHAHGRTGARTHAQPMIQERWWEPHHSRVG